MSRSAVRYIVAIAFLVAGCGSEKVRPEMDAKCKSLLDEQIIAWKRSDLWKENSYFRADITLAQHDAFFSETLGTCVRSQVNPADGRFRLADLSKNFFRDWPEEASNWANIFECGPELYFEAKIDVVRGLNGNVRDVPYAKWRVEDDRSTEGKTHFTAKDCESRFGKTMAGLR